MAKGRTARHTWKAFERRLARWFGFERYSKTGHGEETPDIVVTNVRLVGRVSLDIECKLRSNIPQLLVKAVKQSNRNLVSSRHIPIAVIKEKHKQDDDAMVIMRLGDFKRFFDQSFLERLRRFAKRKRQKKP